MDSHLTKVEIEGFRARTGGTQTMVRVAEHLSSCRDCRAEYSLLRTAGGVAGTRDGTLNFGWRLWLEAEHLEYEQKKSYAEGLMAVDDLEIAERHLEICARCRDEFAGFVADRRVNESEFSHRYVGHDDGEASSRRHYWRLGGLWSPLRAAALVLLALGVAGLTAFLVSDWKDFSPWRGGLVPQIATRTSGPVVEPSVVPTIAGQGVTSEVTDDPRRSAAHGRNAALRGLRMTLNDQGRQLVLESRVRGVTGANDSELDAITGALVAEEISLPRVIADLWGAEGSLRGPRRAAFELLRPRREVVRDTQPVFRWASLKDAASYEVFVADSRHAVVLTSGRLPADAREWRPPAPLIRGEAYSWTVSAHVRGEEMISPTPADAEWKFRVMEEKDLRELNRFESRTESHLARGILFARLGLVTEAEGELQKLLSENPDSTAVRKLLQRVQSWR
ncbi:MAG: hypothetical protein ABI882_13410 [Acidobacteriota bacterium]